MKITRFIAVAAGPLAYTVISAFIVGACAKVQSVKVDEPLPVAFKAMVQTPVKGAFDAASFSSTDKFRVAGDHDFNGQRTNRFSNQEFSYDDATSTWKAGLYWPIGGTMDFLAYYQNVPGTVSLKDDSWPDATRLELVMTDNSDRQGDFLYACKNDAVSGSPVPMTFHHAQAWLQFTAKATSPDDFYLDRIEVVMPYTAGTFVVDNSKVELEAYWKDLAYHLDSGSNPTNVPLAGWTAGTPLADATASPAVLPTPVGSLLLPAQTATKFVIYYKYNGSEDIVFDYTYSLGRGEWESGKKYTYNITFNNFKIEVEPDVENWSDTVKDLN